MDIKAIWVEAYWKRVALLVIVCIGIAGARHASQAGSQLASKAANSSPTSMVQTPPPTPRPTPSEDTERYAAWMQKQGKPVTDKLHEDVSLRIGDWGFFYHGDRPTGSWTPLRDRTALDRSGHAVTEAEDGDWYALLSTSGLDAAGALRRVAWLFNAGGIDPATISAKEARREKIAAPELIRKDGAVIFQGWWTAYTYPPYTSRISITATPASTKLLIEAAKKP